MPATPPAKRPRSRRTAPAAGLQGDEQRFPQAERVHAYARAVLAGRDEYGSPVVAGRHVVAACRRHLADLERAGERGLVWQPARAESALLFFEQVLHLEPGRPFHLQPFQAFIIGSIFGWYRVDQDALPADSMPQNRGASSADKSRPASTPERDSLKLRRRFRTLYAEMGKGNGKTPLMAGIGLYGLTLDPEAAPEIYAFAVAKDQARICFNDAKRMVRASPELARRVEVLTANLSVPARSAKFTLLSSEDRGHHGLRVHMGLGDEIHAHASAAVLDAIDAGTKNCRNSLLALITNSGTSRLGPCWAYHQRALDMLAGKPDDSFFAYVCTLDPCPQCAAQGKRQIDLKCRRCDDWRDLTLLQKANPGLGTILDPDYLRNRVALAQRMPSKLNNVLQLNCCYWTEANNGWLDMHAWRNRCHRPGLRLGDYLGRECYLGLDAANRVDATCLALLFELRPGSGTLDPAQLNDAAREALREAQGQLDPARAPADPAAAEIPTPATVALAAAGYAVFLRTYVPHDMVHNQSQANHEAYSEWARTGPADDPRLGALHGPWLTVTPGAITDFARILDDLRLIAQLFTVKRLQADPRELGYLLQQAAEFLGPDVVVQVTQGPAMISQPMKMFEGLTAAGLLAHESNPVLDWMLGNVEQKTTKAGGTVKYYYPVKPAADKKIDAAPAAFMALDGALRAPADQPAAPYVISVG